MPSSIIDSAFLKDLYGTPEMRAVFNDLSLLQRWLEIEAALAQAEAEEGLIPAWAAEEIARQARPENLDVGRIKTLVDQTVHPIVPLIRVLQEACAGEAGEYVHWGATTQDIMDTAMVLQAKQALRILERRLAGLEEVLGHLATSHRDTIMAGRTHGQQALPITFGFKVAVWLAEVRRHKERLEQVKPRVLTGQFGGAVGTLASLGRPGLQVQARMLEILGLGVPLIAWHTARDSLAEFFAMCGLLSATLGKIAHEIILLQRDELAEVEEPFPPGKVGSSTMPNKRNPMVCEAVLALARLVMARVPLGLEAMLQENERDWSCDHIEWATLPEVCVMTDGALHLSLQTLEGLQVNARRMAHNLDLSQGLILSEAVMLSLAQHVGRQTAHELVYACAMQAFEGGLPFRETLANDPVVSRYLTPEQIDGLLDPRQYTGLAGYFVDQVTQVNQEKRFNAKTLRTRRKERKGYV